MKYFLTIFYEACYWFDYVIGFIMTNPHRLPFYHRYMYQKYGERYCSKEAFDRYWRRYIENDGAHEK